MSADQVSAEKVSDSATNRHIRRFVGLDTLRAATTLLVVFHHTALTYGGTGAWYYREVPVSTAPSSVALTILCALDQSWFMGLFFLLAGYFTPGALDRKGPRRFMADRLLRLGLPILVFGLVLSASRAHALCDGDA